MAAQASAAGPGLPRTYDVSVIDSPAPLPGGGGNFGWGVTSADLNRDGKMELLVAQSQDNVPGAIFIYDGATNKHIDTITPPERNPVFPADDPQGRGGQPNPGEALAFVYVEHVADLGSCPSGTPGGPNEICPDPKVGPQDGIPEIVAGSRALRVGTCAAGQTTCPELGRTGDARDPSIGRAYVFDGRTRAVLKKIDMPLADRQSQVARNSGSGIGTAFGRLVMSPAGLPPCAGAASEVNDAGVGNCDSQPAEQLKPAVRIGDADGIANDPDPRVAANGRADLFISSRGYRETKDPGLVNTAPPSSQCSKDVGPTATSASGACASGRTFMYRGEEISGSGPQEILDGTVDGQVPGGSVGIEGVAKETVRPIKDPYGQTVSQEFSGNMFRIGDVGRCAAGGPSATRPNECGPVPSSPPGQSNFLPDGIPDFVVADRTVDSPLDNPNPTEWPDVGAGYLYDGKTGLLLYTWTHPQPEPRAGFTDGFNSGWPVGNLGHSNLPDFLAGAPTQSVRHIGDGRSYIYNGEATSGRGAEIGVLDDPTPKPAGQFGSSQTGLGDLVTGADTPNNEVMIGSFSPFSVSTEAAAELINDVTIFNGVTERVLQTIPDPAQEPGSGFGVGITPMGDLNGDGFLDFAISSYLSNAPGQPADGRAFIFRSDNSPPPRAEAGANVKTPRLLRPGNCANDTLGTNRSDRLRGTAAGDRMFGFRGNDLVEGLQSQDCLDGGPGRDRLLGGTARDRLIGRSGRDRLSGGSGNDRLFGGGANDRLVGGSGRDLLAGGSGNDLLDGGSGNDNIFGERGADVIKARSGRNRVDGGPGNDRINARNRRRDSIACGSGRDRVLADRIDRVRVDCERVGR